ncbi:hypothetical protein [Rhodococcus marinonascens]|uniref:hypothetical protein n=1 Tax=Rhodococcus marinonascens TaxID=38311 RepID=UPI000A52E4D2|nr:hypothetical protein [Rhodococcus marinonascens]
MHQHTCIYTRPQLMGQRFEDALKYLATITPSSDPIAAVHGLIHQQLEANLFFDAHEWETLGTTVVTR